MQYKMKVFYKDNVVVHTWSCDGKFPYTEDVYKEKFGVDKDAKCVTVDVEQADGKVVRSVAVVNGIAEISFDDYVKPLQFEADDFLTYCVQKYFIDESKKPLADRVMHYAAVMRAVDRNSPKGWKLFEEYGEMVGFANVARQIVNDAVLAGANVTGKG